MTADKRYQPAQAEPALQARWESQGNYHFQQDDVRPVFSIDTPPPTVSGRLHLGHVYSYSHADFIARFQRMRGFNVFYPMGFDDNGLPTERYVEKKLKISAAQVGRQAFIEACLAASEEAEQSYRALWQRLGLSVDWRHTYRTIDAHSQRCAQHSFIDLYHKGLAYRAQAPMIWCPECRTAIAQADMEDRERSTEFVTLPFEREDGVPALPIATTRPELLAACVAVFVHPEDARYRDAVGQMVTVPLYGQRVPVLDDPAADPEKGSGAVMCCTFGDQADAAWWLSHKLPLVEAIAPDGTLLPVANLPGADGKLYGLRVDAARERIKHILSEQGLILERQPVVGTIRVHERCDTPVEILVSQQWFIRVLENKLKFLDLGAQIRWHPAHMQARYRAWVENLNWDWCISRQRVFGVPFPVWYCQGCGEIALADPASLPVDPFTQQPSAPCACGSTRFAPETDLMDTWATSSLSPEIVTGWLDDPRQFERLYPVTLRPQASEIIRTWAFYTIVKAWYHFGGLPWRDVLISGWGLAGEGMGKISKSKSSDAMAPMEMIERYSADAVRYWAASTAPGKDALISEEKIQMGARLVNKLWNVARFAGPFLTLASAASAADAGLFPADRWIMTRLAALIERVTEAFSSYEYAQAKAEIESFFWRDLADNYLEMAKLRLYDAAHPGHAGACQALKTALNALLRMLAPLLPFITDAIWGELFAEQAGCASIHNARWPESSEARLPAAGSISDEALGETLVALATAVRRYKSEHALSLGSELERLVIDSADPALLEALRAAAPDLMSVTRARAVEFGDVDQPNLIPLNVETPAGASAAVTATILRI